MKLFYLSEISSIQSYSLSKSHIIQTFKSRLAWSLFFILINCFVKATLLPFAFQPDHSSFTIVFPFGGFHFWFLHLPKSFNIPAILVNHCSRFLSGDVHPDFHICAVHRISNLTAVCSYQHSTQYCSINLFLLLQFGSAYYILHVYLTKTHSQVYIWKLWTEVFRFTNNWFLFISSFHLQKSMSDPSLWV